jgi:hypothetical protein
LAVHGPDLIGVGDAEANFGRNEEVQFVVHPYPELVVPVVVSPAKMYSFVISVD